MTGSSSDPWVLAIDFGTTSSVVVARSSGRPPEVVELAGERRFASTVLVTDGGDLLLGRVADDLAAATPDRALRAPKSHLGEPHPVVIGGRTYEVVDLVAAILRRLAESATTQMGSSPAEVRLSYPATWSGPRRERLRDAATRAGIADVVLVPEPVAAAVAYAEAVGVSPDGVVAVYDLGGGTFDTTVLRAQGPRWFEVLGRPTGDGQLGGELFDELLLEEVASHLDAEAREQLQVAEDPAWRQAAARLRREVRQARETLSEHPYADVMVALPTGLRPVRVTRSQLDHLLAPYVAETVEILQRAVSDSGVPLDKLDAICLSGGASRTPLVEHMLKQAFPGVPVERRGDPKATIATGLAVATTPGQGQATSGGPPTSGTVIESQVVTPTDHRSPFTVVESAPFGLATAAPSPQAPAAYAPASSSTPVNRRRWQLPAIIVAGALLVSGGVVGGVLAAGSGNGSPSPTTLIAAGGIGGDGGPGPGPTQPPLTTSPTTTPPTTTPPPTTATGPVTGQATQAQVDAALLTTSDLPSGIATPDGAPPLCSGWLRPPVYKDVEWKIQDNGTDFGLLANGVWAYPSVAAAERGLASIPANEPACNHVSMHLGTGPPLCDQSYYGYADNLQEANGTTYDFYIGIVRCASTLTEVDWFIPNFAHLQVPGTNLPPLINTALHIAETKLAATVR